MALSQRFGFIGGGKMAEGLTRALLQSGLCLPDQIAASDVVAARRDALSALGVRAVGENREAASGADVIVVAVQPRIVPIALSDLREILGPGQLVVSIAAGVPTTEIEACLSPGIPVVRVMPNIAVQVRAGAAAIAGGTAAREEHLALVEQILSAAGRCVRVPEPLMDAVTGLSGSGPGYVCLFIDALADGGVKMGLPRDVAITLAAQTLLGGAQLVLESGEHPAVWKDRVATPGGTTIAGLAALEARGVRSALIEAVEAGTRRSQEFSTKR
jgi:pyrroline-5-carboxylate reductase